MSTSISLAPQWRDWGLSGTLHAIALAAMVWGLASTGQRVAKTTRLDLPVSWVTEPIAAPAALVKPAPVNPPERLTKPVPLRAAAPAVAAPKLMPTAQSVVAADTAVPSAVVAAPAAVSTPVVESAHSVKAPVLAEGAPAASKVNEQLRWHNHLEAMLLRHKAYPMVGRRMRQEGVVTVEAQFSAHGELLRCVVATSSGFKALDEAAVQLVRTAAELAREQHQPGRMADLRIPIVYELKDS